MKALIVGGNGFIGTHLVEHLIGNNIKVRVFDRYPSQFAKPRSDVEYITGDLGNHGVLHEIVQDTDWVFHLAYTTLPKTSNEDPIYDVRSNLIDTLQLLEECRQAKVKKVIFVSSGGTVYGVPDKLPIVEQHATDPICSYGITKLAIEKYLHLFFHLYGMDYAITRISNPYGEWQNPGGTQGVITVFLGQIAKGETINIWGNGEVVRDYLHIDDAARALLLAAQYAAPENGPRIFNIGSGIGHSLNQIIEDIRAVVEMPIEVNYAPARSLDVPANILDVSQAHKYLGFKAAIDLPTGIERTWNWIKDLYGIKEGVTSPTAPSYIRTRR